MSPQAAFALSGPPASILGCVAARSPEDDAREAERRLIEKAQSGDRGAMGELLASYGPALYRSVLLPRLGSDAAAKDALSEVYERVVQRIDRFVWQNVGFWPWLRTIGLRVALDQLRARKRVVLWDAADVAREVEATQTATPVDEKLGEHRERRLAKARVEDALGRIHPRYARAIRLRVLEERPREEAARELGVTPATFDVVLHRALQAMKKTLSVPPDVEPSEVRGTTETPASTKEVRNAR